MPVYKYRAKKGSSEIIEDTIEALSEKEAIEGISRMGFLPIRITEESAPVRPDSASLARAAKKIKSRQVTLFSRELASLLKSGVPILSALNIIAGQEEKPYFRNILRDIHENVKGGGVFSDALEKYPKAFSSLYVAILRAGENSGALPESLLRISDYRTKQEEILSRVRMALVYPVLMCIVGLGTVIFMLTFVVPRLSKIFLDMGQDLPLPTQILINISTGIRKWWWVVLLVSVFIAVVTKRQSNTKAGKISSGLFKLNLPVYGKFIMKSEISKFCRTMELLTRNGIPILKSIKIAIPVLNNEIIKRRLEQSHKDLEQGGSFGMSLKAGKIFPPFMSNLITVGEESGKLEEAFDEIANSYERDTDESARIMANLLEPLMILGMGVIVGFIVIAMLLPLFEINL